MNTLHPKPDPHSRRGNSRRGEAGLTLVEVVVSLLIILFGLMAVMQSLTANAATSNRSNNRTEAQTAIARVLDQTRILDVSTLPTSGSADTAVTVGNTVYTVRLSYCVIAAYCTTTARQITATALLNNKTLNQVETIFTNTNGTAK